MFNVLTEESLTEALDQDLYYFMHCVAATWLDFLFLHQETTPYLTYLDAPASKMPTNELSFYFTTTYFPNCVG